MICLVACLRELVELQAVRTYGIKKKVTLNGTFWDLIATRLADDPCHVAQ